VCVCASVSALKSASCSLSRLLQYQILKQMREGAAAPRICFSICAQKRQLLASAAVSAAVSARLLQYLLQYLASASVSTLKSASCSLSRQLLPLASASVSEADARGSSWRYQILKQTRGAAGAQHRMHTSAYVSIRQHTSAYVSIRTMTYADVC
jgi:hypothetical protein